MPVAKGPKFDLRSAAIFGGIAVLAAIVIGFFAVRLGQQSHTLVLGDPNFGQINVFRNLPFDSEDVDGRQEEWLLDGFVHVVDGML